MSTIARLYTYSVFLIAGALFGIAGTASPGQTAPAAPVPTQLLIAKKVFISNIGPDGASRAALSYVPVDDPYNMFYSAMKSWGRFDLAPTPADADVVFEIRLAALGCEAIFHPEFVLTAIDSRTHFVLWTFHAPVPPTYRTKSIRKNVGLAMVNLMDQVQKLTSSSEPLAGQK
jgi:hypothetical protein